jgi:hypothetical protein
MTQHVRVGYRKHRKATWGVALLVAAAIAAIAIPLAGGAPTKELRFGTQPDNFWQKNTLNSVPVGVAVYSGQTIVNQGGTPTIAVAAGSAGTTSDFDFGSPVKTNNVWTWPNAKPKSDADSGLYRFVATLGTLTATSNQFRVSDFVCPPGGGPSCNGTSNAGTGGQGQGKLNITNTIGTPIALDFQAGGGVCGNPSSPYQWHPATYTDSSGNIVRFPAIVLNFTPGSTMLQITYMIRNSEWVLTDTSRGNTDAEFCVGANVPFNGKYGPSQEYAGLNWAVLNTVSNASKVTTDPVVCARGTVDLPTGPNNTLETWRTWTHCIPAGVDYNGKLG